MNLYLLLVAAIAAEVVGTVSLKKSEGFTHPVASAAVVVCYVVAFVLLAQVLKLGMPVSIAYALWAAVGVVAVAAIGAAFLGEKLTATQMVGIASIVAGVAMVELGGSTHT